VLVTYGPTLPRKIKKRKNPEPLSWLGVGG